jgi:hypothetical protein
LSPLSGNIACYKSVIILVWNLDPSVMVFVLVMFDSNFSFMPQAWNPIGWCLSLCACYVWK